MKMRKFIGAMLMIGAAVGLTSCAGGRSMTLTYENPVWKGGLADPHVLYTNGCYYAYGTGKAEDGRHFPILKSTDFTNWEFVGGALAPLKEPKMNEYWAPEVAERNGKYYLYYAGNMKMRVAVADSPQGPFEDIGKWLFPDLPFSIDAHPFHDPVSKQWYLFFAKDFFDQRPGTALAVVQLGDDMISTKGPVHTVIRAFSDWQIYERNRTWYDRHWDAWHTVEGPAVIYRDGKYYCFYSGGNWQTPGYGVGCAVSETITGPYTDPWSKDGASVLSSIPGKLIGPGHNSVILGPDDETYFIVYHSWNPKRTARQMCIDPIQWTENGPKTWQPSRGQKTVTIPLPAEAAKDDETVDEPFGTFVNPIYEGADPFVYKHTDGFYYFCQSEGDKGVAVWKSDKLTDKGVKKVVWWCPDDGWNTSELWAPELHYLNGKWYIYYAADSGKNPDHRTGVLESVTRDPQGAYVDKGMIYTGDRIETKADNRWAIDATPLEMGGKLYLIWSGWNTVNDIQSLYIAQMENPWTVKTNRVKIAENNTYDWEKVGEKPENKGLNEGPQILKHDGTVYVIYSCSGSWQPFYKLGQLSIPADSDPMDPKNWTKKPTPVFTGNDDVYGVGHACFTTSPDDSENWIVYHSKISTQNGWERNVRIQKFDFAADGSPDFGPAITAGIPLQKPAGEKMPSAGKRFRDDFKGSQWDNWCYYGYNRFVDARDGIFRLGYNPGKGTANNYRSGEKAIVRDRLWDDFSFQAKVRIAEGNTAGLIFRVHHPAVGYNALKGYLAGIDTAAQKVVLAKMDGTDRSEIAAKAYPCKNDQWYLVKVVTKNDLVKIYIDDTLVLQARDDTFAKGLAGVRVLDSSADFDDVLISAK